MSSCSSLPFFCWCLYQNGALTAWSIKIKSKQKSNVWWITKIKVLKFKLTENVMQSSESDTLVEYHDECTYLFRFDSSWNRNWSVSYSSYGMFQTGWKHAGMATFWIWPHYPWWQTICFRRKATVRNSWSPCIASLNNGRSLRPTQRVRLHGIAKHWIIKQWQDSHRG